jgi:hypothetical protein
MEIPCFGSKGRRSERESRSEGKGIFERVESRVRVGVGVRRAPEYKIHDNIYPYIKEE